MITTKISSIFCVVILVAALPSFAQTTAEKITQLEGEVAALPSATSADVIKQTVLTLALERANNALVVNLDPEAQQLATDVESALPQAAQSFAARNSAASNLSVLMPLLTVTGNPYLDDMVETAEDELNEEDVAWPRATASNPTFNELNGDYGIRGGPQLMREYFWLFAHEQSPMQYNPELLKRLLRRAHAYIDAVNLDPEGDNSNPAIYDQFAMEAAFSGLYEISELHPGLLLPSERQVWNEAIAKASETAFDWSIMNDGRSPWNLNIETARMVAILNMAYYGDNQTVLNRVIAHADSVINRIRPDGAWPYHGEGNPSVNYHNELLSSLLKIYEQTNHEPIATALTASQWKGPTMGRTDEFWTSPHYKTIRWNFQKGTEAGPEAVATLSGNPYLRWLLNRDRLPTWAFPGKNLKGRDHVAWYQENVTPEPLPNNYTIPDRNVGGPRAWYGEFCYAGAFRANPPDMEGRETLMGAMTVDPGDGRLHSILTDVTPRIWMFPEEYENDDGQIISAWGVLTEKEVAATTITKNYSVSTSIHGITATRRGAYAGPRADWKGRQLWVGLPDRIIGLVSTVPNQEGSEAYAVNGVLRLISGGATGAETAKVLEQIGPGHFRYGQLDILIHASTYTSITNIEKAYRNDNYPAYELTFSDRDSEPAPVGALKSYPANTDYRFVVEVRPQWTNTDVTVDVLGDQNLIGLKAVTENQSFLVWLNTADQNTQAIINRSDLPVGMASLALSEGVLGHPSFVTNIPSQVDLAPGQHSLLVVSGDTKDHEPGWLSFEDMVSSTTPVEGRGPLDPNKGSTLTKTRVAFHANGSPIKVPEKLFHNGNDATLVVTNMTGKIFARFQLDQPNPLSLPEGIYLWKVEAPGKKPVVGRFAILVR